LTIDNEQLTINKRLKNLRSKFRYLKMRGEDTIENEKMKLFFKTTAAPHQTSSAISEVVSAGGNAYGNGGNKLGNSGIYFGKGGTEL
jgi:hypothetical protein